MRVARSLISFVHSSMPFCAVSRNLRSFFFCNIGRSGSERASAVADQADLYGVAQSNTNRVDVELDRPRLSRLRVELDVRERGADHEKRVAVLDRFLRRLGSQQSDAAGGVGAVVGHARFAQQRLDDRRGKRFRKAAPVRRPLPRAPRPASMTTFLPALSSSAARRRSPAAARPAVNAGTSDVCCGRFRWLRFSGVNDWKSTGKLMCATLRREALAGRPDPPRCGRALVP